MEEPEVMQHDQSPAATVHEAAEPSPRITSAARACGEQFLKSVMLPLLLIMFI